MEDRIAAVIIKDKKVLLVTGYDEKFYWSPGGKVDGEEAHEKCLKRELKSELNVNLISLKKYAEYESINEIKNKIQKSHYYLVQIEGEPKPGDEVTKIIWYSKQNFLKKDPKVSKGNENFLIPKLLQDNLL
ncbi:NUDIX domain-containing protein [Candidatus Pacearchaeota archaeon]|nr:NUDIX domain-containing protein [Candidatus Pacearchaeota archaeon]